MFWRTTRVKPLSLPRPPIVTSTSTRLPGPTKPATAVTSSTRTLSARIPSGITIESPPPASLSASFEPSSGSLTRIGVTTPRPSTSDGVLA